MSRCCPPANDLQHRPAQAFRAIIGIIEVGLAVAEGRPRILGRREAGIGRQASRCLVGGRDLADDGIVDADLVRAFAIGHVRRDPAAVEGEAQIAQHILVEIRAAGVGREIEREGQRRLPQEEAAYFGRRGEAQVDLAVVENAL
jgi:hypothetical protein